MNVHPGNMGQVAHPAGADPLCGVEIQVWATEEAAALIDSRLRFLRGPATKVASIIFDIMAKGDDGFAMSPWGPADPCMTRPAASLCTSTSRTNCSMPAH